MCHRNALNVNMSSYSPMDCSSKLNKTTRKETTAWPCHEQMATELCALDIKRPYCYVHHGIGHVAETRDNRNMLFASFPYSLQCQPPTIQFKIMHRISLQRPWAVTSLPSPTGGSGPCMHQIRVHPLTRCKRDHGSRRGSKKSTLSNAKQTAYTGHI